MKILKVTKTNNGIKIITNEPNLLAYKLSDRLAMNNSKFDTIDIHADSVVLSQWEV